MANYNNYNNGGYQQNGNQNGGYQQNGNQNGNRQQERNFNLVQNWNLHVFQTRQTQKGTMLSCAFSGRKKQDGTYAKNMNVSVFIGQNTQCQFQPGTVLDNQNINVSGSFMVDDWTNQQGQVVPNYTVFARMVSIRPQRQNNGGNNGYQQNGGYAPNPQQNYNNAPQNGGYAPAPQQNYNNAPQNGGYAPAPQQNYNNVPQNNGGYAPAPQQNNMNFADFEAFAADDGGVPF